MFCTKCGEELQSDTKFCAACGNPVKEGQEKDLNKKPSAIGGGLSKAVVIKLIIGAAAAILLVTVLFVLFLGKGQKDNFSERKGKISIKRIDGQLTVSTMQGKEWSYEAVYYFCSSSLDGTTAAILMDNSYIDRKNGGKLYLITDKESVFISENVLRSSISSDGKAVVYIEKKGDTDIFELYLFKDGESVRIAENVWPEYAFVSPDGKAVAYLDSEGEAWLWNERYLSIGDDCYPVAVSVNGEFTYVIKDGGLFVFDGNELSRLTANIEAYPYIYTNRTGEEIVYTDNKYNSYVSSFGKKGVKLGEDYVFLLPGKVQEKKEFTRGYIYDIGAPAIFSVQYGIDTFANRYASGYKDNRQMIVKVNDQYKPSTIVRSCKEYFLCEDGVTLVYSDSNGIYRLDGDKAEAVPEVLMIKHTNGIAVSNDGKSVYYTVADDEKSSIYYIQDKEQSVLISEQVDDYQINPTTGVIYYTVEDVLYQSANGEAGIKVASLDIAVVNDLYLDLFSVNIVGENSNGDKVTYSSSDDQVFTLIDFLKARK